MVSADLRGANLRRSNLFGALLFNANLQGTDLSGARLYGALLSRANLFGANLRRAYLADTAGITNEELEQQAESLEGATMTSGQKYEDWLKSKGRAEDGENGLS